MSSQYRNLPDKIVRVRTHDGTQHFWPIHALRGIRRVSGNYVEIYFDGMLRMEGGGGTHNNASNEVDVVKIRFDDVQGGAWGSIIKMYEKLMTGKAIVFTIADTYDDPPFYNLQEGKTKRDPSLGAAGDWDNGTPVYGQTTSPNLNEENLDLTVIVIYRKQFPDGEESYP